MNNIQFVNGIRVFEPNKEFIKAEVKINKEELRQWLNTATFDDGGLDKDGNIKAQIKVGKSGKWYLAVNKWQPKVGQSPKAYTPPSPPPPQTMDDFEDDIPF